MAEVPASSRSPRAVPFAILAVLTVLALAAAALAIATAPSTSKAAVASRGPDHGHRRRHGPDRLGPRVRPPSPSPGPSPPGRPRSPCRVTAPRSEVWYPPRRALVKGVAPATYNLSDWLPTNLKALLPPATRGSSYPTGAYRGVPAAQGSFPARGLSATATRLSRPVELPHVAPRHLGFVVAAPTSSPAT